MRAWWGLPVLATGCLSLQTGASVNAAMTDTPVRRGGAPVLVGTFIPVKQIVIEPHTGFVLGPLGNKSEAVLSYAPAWSLIRSGFVPGTLLPSRAALDIRTRTPGLRG